MNIDLINKLDELNTSQIVSLFRTVIIADNSTALNRILNNSKSDCIFNILRSDNIIRLIFHYKSIKCFRVLIKDTRLDITIDNNFAIIYSINNNLKWFIRTMINDIRVLKCVYPSMLRFKYFNKLLYEKFDVDSDEDVIKCIQLL